MNCERVRHLLHERIDGLIDDRAERELVDHLSTCRSCAAIAADFEMVHDGLSALRSATDLPEAYSAQAIPRREVSTARHHGRIAAALALLVGAGLIGRTLINDLATRPTAVTQVPTTGNAKLQHDSAAPSVPVGSTVEVKLIGASSRQYVSVTKKTDRPNVHVIWLYPSVSSQKNDTPPESRGPAVPSQERRAVAATRPISKGNAPA